jgi:hypothetical protein
MRGETVARAEKREAGRSAASQTEGEGSNRGGAIQRRAAWGLAPTGERHPDRVPADCDPGATRAGGASLFRTGAR